MRVLLIEDDYELRESLSQSLENRGYVTQSLDSPSTLHDKLKSFLPDVILMDYVLPHKSGYECVSELRNDPRYVDLPIIMVTGVINQDLKIQALEGGVDDYLEKPFMPRELFARIQAVTRRQAKLTSVDRDKNADMIACGDVMMEMKSHRVRVNNQEVPLTLTEFRLLQMLLSRVEEAISRDELRQSVLGHSNVTDRTIDVHVAALRRKLGVGGRQIQTVRGIGYRIGALAQSCAVI